MPATPDRATSPLMTDTTRQRDLIYVGIIVLLALIIRVTLFVVIYGMQQQPSTAVGGGDASAYEAMSHYIYYGQGVSSSLFLPRPFLFPVLAATIYGVVGENVWAVIVFNILLNVLTCVLIFRLAQTIGQSSRIALVAGILAAVYPGMILGSIGFMTESTFLFFYTLGLLLFARFVKVPNWRDLLLSSIIFAFATLTRSVTVLLPILLIALIVGRTRGWWRYAIAVLIIAVMPVGLLTLRNWYYGNIVTMSTEAQWMLLFMRATSSERRATGESTERIYARYIQEIERRLGNPVPALESIQPTAIWDYFQPTPKMHSIISQLAIERNLAYPQWYVLNTFYGLHRIIAIDGVLPEIIAIPLYYVFTLCAMLGLWVLVRSRDPLTRRWGWLLGIPTLMTLGLTVVLETGPLDTRHGLPAALPMFILASQGIAALLRYRRERAYGKVIEVIQG